MDIGLKEYIIAVVTYNPGKMAGGGVPIFVTQDRKEAENVALFISKATLAMVHDTGNDSFIIVRH
jgi:hypothetical protein